MRFGRQLREERERVGVSLEEIAAVTRVPLRQLHSLEADLFDELPPGVVRRGIMRSYCRHIGLDEGIWLAKFTESGGLPADEPDPEKLAEFAENIRRGRSTPGPVRRRWIWVALMLLALGAAGFAAWKFIIQPHVFPAVPQPSQIQLEPSDNAPRTGGLEAPDATPHAPAAPAPTHKPRHPKPAAQEPQP